MIFGIDIGHSEGWWPVLGWPEPVAKGQFDPIPPVSTLDGMKEVWGGLEADKMMPYLEYNFFKAYPNVDRAALQETADRVGPTASELGLV